MAESAAWTADSVATVTVRVEMAYAGGVGPPWSVGAPLNGPLRLVLTDGTEVTGDLSAGATPVSWGGEPPDEEFSHGTPTEAFHVALPTLVGLERLAFETDAGSYALVADTSGTTTTLTNLWIRVGCQRDWYNFNQCKADAEGPLKGAKFGLSATVTAAPVAAFVLADTTDVACGSSATLRARAVTAGGGDAWMDPREILTLSVPPSAGHFDGALDPNDGWLQIDALTAYAGVLFRAASCDAVSDTTNVEFRVLYQHQGLDVSAGTFRVLPRPAWPPSDPPDPPTCPSGGRLAECSVPVVRLLRQNGAAVAATGPDAYVMVSKVRPDWLLPTDILPFAPAHGTVPFPDNTSFPTTGPSPTAYYDPDTYRPEAWYVPASVTPASVRFRLSVSRGDQPVVIWDDGVEDGAGDLITDFPAVCEASTGGYQTCRGDRYVRFVSNARPVELASLPRVCDDALNGTCYDDEVSGTQTVRVELGDRVRWEVLGVNGADALYTVGASGGATSDPSDVARSVRVRFTGTENLEQPMDAAGTARQMDEMWAQTGLNFQVVGQQSVPDFRRKVIEIDTEEDDIEGRPARFPQSGIIGFEYGGLSDSLTVSRGDLMHEAVEQLIAGAGIPPESGIRVVRHADRGTDLFQANHGTFIYRAAGGTGSFRFWTRGTNVRLRHRDFVSDRLASPDPYTGLNVYGMLRLEAHVLALMYGDGDRTTVDVFALPGSALEKAGKDGLRGFAFIPSLDDTMPALLNSCVVGSTAADGVQLPDAAGENANEQTAGHEVGHILFDGTFPGHVRGHTSDSITDNVMTRGGEADGFQRSLGARRRLWNGQQTDARTSQPSLLFPFVPSLSIQPDAPAQTLSLPVSTPSGSAPIVALPNRE